MTRWPLGQGYDDFYQYVNPGIVLRAELANQPYRLMRVDGEQYVDVDGHRLDDFLCGWGTQAFGPRNPHVEQALIDFMGSDRPGFFTSVVSPYAGTLARTLFERTGEHYNRAWFASGGSEVVEAAIKMARAATGRPGIVHLNAAYHGCTMGSCAMMAQGIYRDAFGPHLPDVIGVMRDDIDALEQALSTGDVAAVIVEPIQVEGGVYRLSDAFVDALCDLTTQHDVVLIVDEIQTGLGRTGRMLWTQDWPRRPDVVCLAKALGGGVMPLSAMLTTQTWFERAYGDHVRADIHNSTFSGNAMACVAGLATMELLTPSFLDEVTQKGQAFHQALQARVLPHELVSEIRGEGLLAGIVLQTGDHPWLSFEYLRMEALGDEFAAGLMLCHRLHRAGFFCNVSGHDWTVVRVQPSLTIELDRLMDFVDATVQSLDFLCQL